MTTKERILMIRLAQKLESRPAFAKALGIEATGAVNNQKKQISRKGLADA